MTPAHVHAGPVVAILLLAGCASYQPPPLTAGHPAHPDAPTARAAPPSSTLAYTRAEVDAIRAMAAGVAPRPDQPARAGGAASANTVVGVGEVVSTAPNTGQIVIDHDEIKGFMEAMTMGYRIDPPSLLATVKPGDRIRFTIDIPRRAIIHIEPVR
jgi:Cu/Ag efflux protein CusF